MQHITVNGTEYPATFSLRVAMRAAEKYGTVQAIFQGGDEAGNISKRVWLLHELLEAGKTYAEKEQGETIGDIPSYDDLLDVIDFNDISEVTLQILQVLSDDQRQTVSVESKKNEATPGQ